MLAAYKRTRLSVISWLEKMRRTIAISTCVLIIAVSGLSVFARDWPQFLGPQRNGIYSGARLASSWPAGAPKRVRRRPVGPGLAGSGVARGCAVPFSPAG